MKAQNILPFIFFYCIQVFSFGQNVDMKNYTGEWRAEINPGTFTYQIKLEKLDENSWTVSLNNGREVYRKNLESLSEQSIQLQIEEKLSFKAIENENEIIGFLSSMDTKFHLVLTKNEEGDFVGEWRSFYVKEILPSLIYVSIENGIGEYFEAYPSLPDNRYRGTYSVNFVKEKDVISFDDRRSGHSFKGVLNDDFIDMQLMLGSTAVSQFKMKRSLTEWQYGTSAESPDIDPFNPEIKIDQVSTSSFSSHSFKKEDLLRMVDSINANQLTHVHSVLIAHKGSLIYENYFNGFDSSIGHDTRSASKSIGSAIIGIAQKDGLIADVNSKIFDYIPQEYQYTKNEINSSISIHDLLTMSSGMDAIDFGLDRYGAATEDVYQSSDNWLKTVLEAPMIYEPGTKCYYGSANPYLLGVAVDHKLKTPVENYMDEKLFEPLGIVNYSMPMDSDDSPYFGGGTYLTPRDMMKFGLLYRNKGIWNKQRIIEEDWINESFTEHHKLLNTSKKNGYGYLFWMDDYKVDDKSFKAIEARGAGGQYISIIEELDLVIVITSGNYRNGRYWQPEMIIEDYILPTFVE